MNRFELKKARRLKRKYGIRRRITGTSEKPRLSIYRSLTNIFAQLIDDTKGLTLAQASTVDKEIKSMITPEMTKTDLSKLVGKALAQRAVANNISQAVFDRNGYLYHGRVKAFADSVRENGLKL
jgi:large subunit ribosomal protein L18